jgi:hypothetical protein
VKSSGDLDVLKRIEGRDGELRSGDVREGIDTVDPVNGRFDSVIDRSDVVLNGRPEISEGALDEVGDLWEEGQTNRKTIMNNGVSGPLGRQR